MRGEEIAELGHSFFELRRDDPLLAMIPYHRVLRIEVDGALVWERRSRPPGPASPT